MTDQERVVRLRRLAAALRERSAEQRRRQREPMDPRQSEALAGFVAVLERPRRIEVKLEMQRLFRDSYRASRGLAPSERLRIVALAFEKFAAQVRLEGDPGTAAIADEASDRCNEMSRMLAGEAGRPEDAPLFTLVSPAQLSLEA